MRVISMKEAVGVDDGDALGLDEGSAVVHLICRAPRVGGRAEEPGYPLGYP